MNNPVSGNAGMPYVSRGRRRRWVLAMYLCTAAVALWLAFGGNHWSLWLAIAPLVAAATIYLGLVVPIARALTEREDLELDERQLAVRNRAYFHAFRILGIVIFGAVLYGHWLPDPPGRSCRRRGPPPILGPWASSSRSC